MKKIKFYPFSEETLAFAPKPEPASKFLPDWYKKMPATVNPEAMSYGQAGSTVKKCMPVFDLMTSGYILSAPCDIFIDATNPEKIEWSIPSGILSFQGDMFAVHAREQYDKMPINTDIYHKDLIRIFPFWAVGTPKGYSSIFIHPPYMDSSPLVALQAIVDTDAFVTDGHLSFWVEKDFKGIIKKNTPLVQVIPFKRESWSKDIRSAQESEGIFYKQRLRLRSTFANAYKNMFRSRKDYS